MIVASCPLRVSLVGGSTDHPRFLEKFGKGSVISFASNLKTYIALHRDTLGLTQINKKYSIKYTKFEECENVENIKNDVVREVFKYFNVPYCICSLTSDIISVGSGLASSSSYMMSLIKAVSMLNKIDINNFEICQLANKLEKKFNPLVGQQDFYGGCIGGLKKIIFYPDKQPDIIPLNTNLFKNVNFYLIFTQIYRNSTSILDTIDIDKSFAHLETVDRLEDCITSGDINNFCQVIKDSWQIKKKTSSMICSEQIINLDQELYNDPDIMAHKLCGAGGGGFFFIIAKNIPKVVLGKLYTKIDISSIGIAGQKL